MKPSHARLTILIALLALIMVCRPRGAGAEPAGRAYAPVQAGPGAEATVLSDHAPGRIMLRLRAEDLARSSLAGLTRGGEAAAAPVTGLPALDARLQAAGAVRIARAHGPFADAALASRLGADRVFRVDVAADADIPALAAELAADPAVEFAAPDRRAYLAYVPNDPSYGTNWGHDNTAQLPAYDWSGGTNDHTLAPVGLPGFDADTDLAWDQPTAFGSPSVIIAVLDSGVDLLHGDLPLVPGYDFGDGDPVPADDIPGVAGHGTCCAGVAAAIPDNGYVAAGVAGGCAIMPLKVGDSAGNLYLSYVANALYHAANNGARVVSMSFSTPGIMSDPLLDPAIQYTFMQGLVLLAAAGNDNTPVIDYPANRPEVIAVGAASPCGERKRSSSNPADLAYGVLPDPNSYTCDGERWWGSNYGPMAPDGPDALDVLAPTMLPTTDITGPGGYRSGDLEPWFNGTSCATPYAAGICALILSADPSLSPMQVRDYLVQTATDVVGVESSPGWDRYSGYGLVNADRALQAALTPVADFSVSASNGCQPLQVQFTDLSSGLVTGWQWDFGDGSQDFTPNPAHVYPLPGTYTVTLTVTGPVGTDTMVITDLITVDPLPVADFTASVVSGDFPLSVDFTDMSAGEPNAWQWDFGDGQTSVEQDPTHVYAGPGFYTVILSAQNGCGGDMMVKQDYIEVTDPASAADAPAWRFALAPASPNPFNPTTTLAYELAADGPARLAVYDAAGRSLAVLVDGPCEAGRHTVDWRPRGLASGVYFAKLQAGGETAIRRLTLLR